MAADCGVWWSRAGVVAVVAVIAWERPGWVLSFVSLFFAVAVAHLAGWRGKELRTVALTVAVCAAAVDYLSWRLTVVSLSSWFVALPLFLAETHAALHTVGLHASLWPRKPEALRRDVNPTLFPVFVFVPTVDEGPAIVRETLLGILAARRHYLQRYPHASVRIIVCNDGGVANADCSHDVIRVCRSLRVECITRTVGGGAKAGNFENARRLVGATGDALLVIFDADQIPREDFFLATIAPFRDSTVGWVQTGQFYRNRANPVARWADDQQSLFYRLICPAKATHDAAFICGTNVVLRARALDEIGGLPTDSVTEDFAASIMLAPRWRSVYLSGVYATGLGPIDIRSYLRQQERWARGTLTVLRLHWRDILLPRRGGMRISQRVQYALACTHYLSGPRDLVFLVAPVLFVFTGISGVHGATLGQFLQHFVPFYLLTLAAFWHAARTTTSWRAVVIGFASFPALLKATWMTAAGRRGIFTLTPKKRRDTISARRNAVPYLAAILLCGLALAAAVTIRRSPEVWLAAFWLAYLCLMLFATLALIRADTRFARLESVAPDSLPVITRR